MYCHSKGNLFCVYSCLWKSCSYANHGNRIFLLKWYLLRKNGKLITESMCFHGREKMREKTGKMYFLSLYCSDNIETFFLYYFAAKGPLNFFILNPNLLASFTAHSCSSSAFSLGFVVDVVPLLPKDVIAFLFVFPILCL